MKKYVLVGASARGLGMYAEPMVNKYKKECELVGIFDINSVRAQYAKNSLNSQAGVYTDFELMMKETKPDIAIIATMDRYHHEYIIRALELGSDVIVEKPMTIDDEKCKAIFEAEKRTGKKVIVTFNCRFVPHMVRVKELLMQGIVGKILNVDFEWILDTSHGADYFRRWHRRKENSGGLLVHKATHHFDLINWWIGEEPEEVYANGTRRFYGPTRENRGERCSNCRYSSTCEFAVNFHEDELYKELYFKAEVEDGYFRDRCVFDEEIDIEDSMSVTVKYSKGALLTYSLIAHSPYEGWKVAISGTEGRLETSECYSGLLQDEKQFEIKVFNRKGEIIVYNVPINNGVHGGGDEKILEMLYKGYTDDPLHQNAGSYEGANSVMIGVCANKSIKEKKPFYIKELLKHSDFNNKT